MRKWKCVCVCVCVCLLTHALSRVGIFVCAFGTRDHTLPVLQAGVGVGTRVTLLCAWSVTQLTVPMATPTHPALGVTIETTRALRYTVALVEEVGLLALFGDTMKDLMFGPHFSFHYF